ncbi:MAG: hypothetical protein QOI29_2938 [Mycobacterium sp.]|nr:hypothetical protein [Mycobacterium sp.]
MPEDFDEESGLPLTNRDESCAFCGANRPAFVHPLDVRHVQFRVYDKGWTLPTFWAVCSACEPLIQRSDDDELLRRMAREGSDERLRRGSLAAFRAANLGPTPLRDVSE